MITLAISANDAVVWRYVLPQFGALAFLICSRFAPMIEGVDSTRLRLSPALKQAVVLVLGLAFGFGVLLGTGLLEPEDLLVRGELGPSESLIAKDFGPGHNPGMTGFDGQQTYAIAREFPDLDRAAPALDNPRYRMLRILQPAVASLAPPGTALVVALLSLGILGCGLAAYAVGDFAQRYGHHPRAGWLVGLALISSVAVTAVDALAFGLALFAAALADRSRLQYATIAFVAAALTKESAVVVAGATALALAPRLRWRLAPLAIIPAGALLAWYVWLGRVVGGELPERTSFLALEHADLFDTRVDRGDLRALRTRPQ